MLFKMAVLLAVVALATSDVVLEDPTISLTFGDHFELKQIENAHKRPLLSSPSSWWVATVLVSGKKEPVTLTSLSSCSNRTFTRPTSKSLELSWKGVTVESSSVDVLGTIFLPGDGSASMSLSFSTGASDLALWEWQIVCGGYRISSEHSLVQNRGFGTLHQCRSGCPSFSQVYPSATYQFLAGYTSSGADGLYFGVHDRTGASKVFSASVKSLDEAAPLGWTKVAEDMAAVGPDCPFLTHGLSSNLASCEQACDSNAECNVINYRATPADCVLRSCSNPTSPKLSRYAGYNVYGNGRKRPVLAHRVDFGVSAQPPGAGLPLTSYKMEYPVVIAVFDGDWWDAAMIYRSWALPNAPWTSKGPIATRPDSPKWIANVTTWVNSHWQGRDIFNTTGGDPTVVLNRVSSIVDRFNVGTVGLHWYEWDTLGYAEGSNYTKCASEVTCGFDTHYPEYFPVRRGFKDALTKLQQKDVRITPYINGRIWDKATKMWSDNGGYNTAAKSVPALFNSTSYTLYDEQYGSKAKFAVSCPHTSTWQTIIGGVVGSLVNDYKTDGVYIDQIAAAGARNCWDPQHHHTQGGGSYWVDGYRNLLDDARKAAGNDALLLTESNAEPFMDGLDMFLTLVGFGGNFAGDTQIIPVFPAVYGGYYYSMGAEFYQEDLTSNPDVFAAKIACQFMYGAQMGWFSLGGRTNQEPYMGMYDQLMDSEYDAEIEYLRRLADYKLQCNPWLQNGRRARDLPLRVNGSAVSTVETTHMRQWDAESPGASSVGLVFPSVLSAAWIADSPGFSLMATVTTVERHSSASIAFDINIADYGYKGEAAEFEVVVLPSGRSVGTFPRNSIKVSTFLEARDVLAVVIKPGSKAIH